MKQYLRLFGLCLLWLSIAMGMRAQVRYEVQGELPITDLSEIEGKTFALQGFNSRLWMNGAASGKEITEAAAFELEAAATADCYYLKNVHSGQYLENPQLSGNDLVFTSSKMRAAEVQFVHPLMPDEPWEELKKDQEKVNAYDWTKYTVDNIGSFTDQVYMLVVRFSGNNDFRKLIDKAGNTNGPQWHKYVNFTSWYIYPIQRLRGYDLLNEVFNSYFPSSTTEGMFAVGEGVGQVLPVYYDALQKAFAEAEAILNAGSGDEAACEAVLERLTTAYRNCKEKFNPLVPGYYLLRAPGRSSQCMMKAEAGKMVWEDHKVGETLDLEDAPYVWKFEADEAVEHGFKLQNFATGQRALSVTKVGYNVAIPMAESEGHTYVVTIHPTEKGKMGMVDPAVKEAPGLGLHADQHHRIVKWYANAQANAWQFEAVSESVLNDFQAALANAARCKEAAHEVRAAMMALAKGKTYASDATPDGHFDLDGLITELGEGEHARLWSNAPEDPNLEANNGAIGNLLDNDFTTYFHSVWSHSTSEYEWHNLCADLGEAVEALAFKYARRHNNSAGSPVMIHVYATNDTTGCRLWGDGWVDQGYMELTYPYACEVNGEKKEGFVGISGISFDQPYRFVRFDVEQTQSGNRTSGNLFFYFSEARFYKGTYDAENSLIQTVPAAVVQALQDAVAAVKTELAEKEVSIGSLEALKKARADFDHYFPDPMKVTRLLQEAKAQAAHAVEGNDLGYFKEGAKAQLQATLNEIEAQVKKVMDIEEIHAALSAIEDALQTFNAQLIVPKDGEIYHIQCATASEDNPARGTYLYAQDNGEKGVRWGLSSQENGDDPNLSNRLESYWRVKAYDDGTFNFQNVATGHYMGTIKNGLSKSIPMVYADSAHFRLRSAKAEGLFNIVLTDQLFANASPTAAAGLVSWNSANGRDNSAFKLLPVAWDDSYYIELPQNDFFHLMTLPFSIYVDHDDMAMYGVDGIYEGKLQLSALEAGTVWPAATPFFFQRQEGMKAANLMLTVDDLSDLTYDWEGKTHHGLVGVLRPQEVGKPVGVLFNDNFLWAAPTTIPAANTGYLDVTKLPKLTKASEVQLPLEPALLEVITGIAAPMQALPSQQIYDLQGRRVLRPQQGIYIINGQKVWR